MSDTTNNNLVFALGLGAICYWWWSQQNQAGTSSGIADTIEGQASTLTQNLTNYVENTVMGNTKGERNNNPGNLNLRDGSGKVIPWQGLSATQTDSRFAQFDDVTYGIRALHKNLMTMFGRGLNNVQKIITAWAPQKDNNNTAAYIADICNRTGFAANQIIDMNDATTAAAMCNAIILHENGSNPYLASGQFDAGMGLT